MTVVTSAAEFGRLIRNRRKEVGWDQARLAQAIGASRQWVIDIEKGKPRAELELALRAMRSLGLDLVVSSQSDGTHRISNDRRQSLHFPTVRIDIDAIVEGHKSPYALLTNLGRTFQAR